MGIYECLGGQQLFEVFVGIFPELSCICGGVMLPDLVVMAMGEMVVGIPSRDAPTILVLT